MRITDIEFERVKKLRESTPAQEGTSSRFSSTKVNDEDKQLFDDLVKNIMAMSDRENLVNTIRENVLSGTYKPAAMEIVDAMIHRSVADRV